MAPNISVVHGFSTRHGGVSLSPYASLNLGDHVGDEPEFVAENRRRALETFELKPNQLACLNQVHGDTVVYAVPGSCATGDALVYNRTGVVLAVATADCVPILLADEQAQVIAAVHAGWRGTVLGTAAKALAAMQELGASSERIRVAIGPSICASCYEVGAEVSEAFVQAGLPETVMERSFASGGWRVDLARANAWWLRQAGVLEENIWISGACSTDEEFFSHRRDRGVTGRMWAVIALVP